MYRICIYLEFLVICIFLEKFGVNIVYICMLDDNYIEVVNINFINFIFIKDVFWIYIILIIYKIFD